METERTKKQICNVFKNNNLKVTIEVNRKVINFLDITLDLNIENFKLYAKPTNTLLYVQSKSNHPPSIIKNIPDSVNRRLLKISSDAGVFDEAAKPYQEALGKSGYSFKLEFKPPQTSLIDQSFSSWTQISNRNTLKFSYRCKPHVTQIICGHNKTILRRAAQTPQDQATKTCPLKGTCLSKGMIYQGMVMSPNNCTEI